MGTMAADKQVVFLAAVRTPFGTFGGSLKDHSATELGILSGRVAVERAGVAVGAAEYAWREAPR